MLGAKREELDAARDRAREDVREAVEKLPERKYSGRYEIIGKEHPDIAIIVAFDVAKLGVGRFGRAVGDCASEAFDRLNSLSK